MHQLLKLAPELSLKKMPSALLLWMRNDPESWGFFQVIICLSSLAKFCCHDFL
jgi:hypothetical protein